MKEMNKRYEEGRHKEYRKSSIQKYKNTSAGKNIKQDRRGEKRKKERMNEINQLKQPQAVRNHTGENENTKIRLK